MRRCVFCKGTKVLVHGENEYCGTCYMRGANDLKELAKKVDDWIAETMKKVKKEKRFLRKEKRFG